MPKREENKVPDVNAINQYLQGRLKREGIKAVSAVDAGRWLDQAGLLDDSESRRGLPIRKLLRENKIIGGHQDSHSHWFITLSDNAGAEISLPAIDDSAYDAFSYDTSEDCCILPDYLVDGLDIVFVGTAVGDKSASRKHYYARHNNSFYQCIYRAHIVPVMLRPEDDRRLLEYKIGLTDIIKTRHTSDDSTLSSYELSQGITLLRHKILSYKPRIVCFNGKMAFKAFTGSDEGVWGLAKESIGTSRIFVVPSTSARVAANKLFDGKNRLQWFEALAQFRRDLIEASRCI